MQYVRSLGGSVSGAWNAINPANLSGAIDVIAVEQEDGTLACSPFHVRFGKFSLLRPYEKKVEFKLNDVKQPYAMKLGEGGDAFFVFETQDDVPEGLQTSPLISPAGSPQSIPAKDKAAEILQEPEPLDISGNSRRQQRPLSAIFPGEGIPVSQPGRAQSDLGNITPLSSSPLENEHPSRAAHWLHQSHSGIALERTTSLDMPMPHRGRDRASTIDGANELASTPQLGHSPSSSISDARSRSPPRLSSKEAFERAMTLSKKLESSNIPSRVMETGDLMLDMQGYKSKDEDALRAEVIARQLLAEEMQGDYDVGAIMGADEEGNLWIYSSEEAKEAAYRRRHPFAQSATALNSDAASDPGVGDDPAAQLIAGQISNRPQVGMVTPPQTPPNQGTAGDPNKNYVKTLRLTSDQLKSMKLKPGANKMTFTVARATCTAWLFYWSYKVPIVVSDIDGTITKSDALGHVLNMIGRDWTHVGVAKLYSDIAANGYNIFYLSSRSVGQADTTRTYLNGIVQDGYKLPHGPVILSPDRTLAALRREVYLRQPQVFKMACLRDIHSLYAPGSTRPFYAGFGNRFTDALSYRYVSVPRGRIFTVNSNAEVSLDLVNFGQYRSSYTNIRDVVDHYFPPISMLVEAGAEEFTDFGVWRDRPRQVDDFSDSSDDEDDGADDRLLREAPSRGAVSRTVSMDQRTLDEDEDEDEEDEDDEEDVDEEDEEADDGESYLSEDVEDMEASMVESLDEIYLSPRGSMDDRQPGTPEETSAEEYLRDHERTPRRRVRADDGDD